MENPSFHLEGIIKTKDDMEDFEGPLSLILMLLSKNKIEIRDVSISQILEQYLQWLSEAQHMDLEIASEFVQMASHLVYIKTKTLLAGTEEVSELELLLSGLEQMKNRDRFLAVKQMAPHFEKSLEYGAQLFSAPGEPQPKFGEYSYEHRGWELLAALARMTDRSSAVPETAARVAMPKPIIYSTREKSRQILRLFDNGQSVSLNSLYAMAVSRSELVATFISVLEMCAMGSVLLEKQEGDYILHFAGGDTEEILESISE